MLRRPQGNLTAVAAVLLTLTLIWIVRAAASTSSSLSSGTVTTEPNRKEVRRITPQHPLGIVPTVPVSSQLKDIMNSTLGFQKIFIISMSSRSDKRDALTLSAYLTGLDIEFIDGVNGSSVSRKAYPENWNMKEGQNTIGTWRAHMEVYQKMVRERIHSALIMEDDVDWDVMLKAQMTELARGTRYLQQSPSSTHSPYGDGWDIMSTGHCGIWNKVGEDQSYWVIKDDATVVAPDRRWWWRKPDMTPDSLTGNYTRIVFSNYKFTCLASYAVSLPGAARILYDQSILPHAIPIDLAISQMCRNGAYGFNMCLAAYPMITGVHRPAGDMSKESDRSDGKEGKTRTVAVSEGLVFPIRMNLEPLLKGESVVKAQMPESALLQEIDTATFRLPSGLPAFVKKSEYRYKEEAKKAEEAKIKAEEVEEAKVKAEEAKEAEKAKSA